VPAADAITFAVRAGTGAGAAAADALPSASTIPINVAVRIRAPPSSPRPRTHDAGVAAVKGRGSRAPPWSGAPWRHSTCF